ncbi:hypothetical protein VARIO8X_70044 [Burkholderiales bacterium 8X]|nr:hypothetical protein VARIO8X_70044 [Burkholderiales bacterium 8X]
MSFRFGEAVLEVATPRVRTSRETLYAERVAVCTNTELHGLFADRLARHDLRLCQLQMLRVQPESGFRLPGSVMGDLSLVRYRGYSELPEAAALLAELQREEAESLTHGIHLIVVQSADGSLARSPELETLATRSILTHEQYRFSTRTCFCRPRPAQRCRLRLGRHAARLRLVRAHGRICPAFRAVRHRCQHRTGARPHGHGQVEPHPGAAAIA